MDFPATAAPAPANPWGRVGMGAALLALAIYGVVLALNVGAVAGGSDSSGYMNNARLIAAGQVHVQPRTIEGLPPQSMPSLLYVPLGFKPAWNGDGIVPTYPTGFALVILALKPLVGWRHAGDLAIVLHALLGIVATFGLARWLGLERGWSVLAAAIVGLSPVYLFMSLQAMSDIPSMAWSTLAVLFALKSRERTPWALAAGAALAAAVLLRPTNILLLAPVALALGVSPRRWVLLLSGGLPGAVYFCMHSLAAYGRLAATGYGDDAEAFHASYIAPSLAHYAHWIPVLFTPLVILACALPLVRSGKARVSALLIAWILIYAAFYAAYKNTHEAWWYLRFLLPVAPALATGSLLVLCAGLARWPAVSRSPYPLVAAAVLVGANAVVWGKDLNALDVGRDQLQYGKAMDWMTAHVPANAICVAMQASGSLFYYTHFTFVRWDVVTKDNVGRLDAAVRASGRPFFAVLFPFELNEDGAVSTRIPGRWNVVGRVENITILKRDFGAEKH